MTMPQVDSLQHGNMEDYCDVYHLDTAVILWKADNVEEADRARDYIKTLRLDDIEVEDLVALHLVQLLDRGQLELEPLVFGGEGVDQAHDRRRVGELREIGHRAAAFSAARRGCG